MFKSLLKKLIGAFIVGSIKGKTVKELNRHEATQIIAEQSEALVQESVQIAVDVAVEQAAESAEVILDKIKANRADRAAARQ